MSLHKKRSKARDEELLSAAQDEEGGLSETDEKHGKKERSEAAESEARLVRVVYVLLTLVVIVSLDVVASRESIYSRVVNAPTDAFVSRMNREARATYNNAEPLKLMVDENQRLELLLLSTGASRNKAHGAYELGRIARVLSKGADADPGFKDVERTELGKFGSDFTPLFRNAQDVLELGLDVDDRVSKRRSGGKAMFAVSKEGYTLDAELLRGVLGGGGGGSSSSGGGGSSSGSSSSSSSSSSAGDGGAAGGLFEGVQLVNRIEQAIEAAEVAAAAAARAREAADALAAERQAAGLLQSEEDGDGGKDAVAVAAAQVEVPDRKLALATRAPDAAFVRFREELRMENTYAYLGKKNDMERALKAMGYKQSVKTSKKAPLWVGWEDRGRCPSVKKDDGKVITLCPFYIPMNKADQFAQLQAFQDKVPGSKLRADFYPLTWRLYKEKERQQLKLHCTNESMSEFGEAYVRKFTVPGSNYMKNAENIYDQLVKSDKKLKELTKEAKNRAIVQLYINNPLLIEERKFIIRTFAVTVSAKPFIVFYHDGAVFRSIVKYSPFSNHEAGYKKAAHITSEQKSAAHSKVLKSSELYASFNSLQGHLKKEDTNTPETWVNAVLRPQMKARMIYSLAAIFNRQRSSEEGEDAANDQQVEQLPNNAAAVQTHCFDFLLDTKKQIHLIAVSTGSHCFINMGGSSYRPPWKVKLQEALSDNTAALAEEILWRRLNNKPISSMRFFTQTGMTVLIDETFPDWDLAKEINAHMDGVQVAQDGHDYNSAAENMDDEIEAIIQMPSDGAAAKGADAAQRAGDQDDDAEPDDDKDEQEEEDR